MDKVKLYIKILIMLIAFYIFSDFMIFSFVASTYNNMEYVAQINNDIEIKVTESKATYLGGYANIKLINNANTSINNKYLVLEAYSELDNNLTTKFIKISDLYSKNSKEYKINYKAQKATYIKIYISDEIPNNSLEKKENEKPNGIIYLFTGLILLYFLG